MWPPQFAAPGAPIPDADCLNGLREGLSAFAGRDLEVDEAVFDSERSESSRNLALAYCRLGRWDEGIAELKKVLDADPDDQDAIKALYVATEQARRARR